MKIININKTAKSDVITQTLKVLGAGGLVIFPTETTYGAGVDATNQRAVNKLLKYKSRREGKPLSIVVTNETMAEKYVEINDQARSLYQQFLPGPVTVVSKGLGKVASGVESEFGTLGIRVPDYSLILELVEKFQMPITATSANASGKRRPYSVKDILDNLSDRQKSLVDLFLDAGELPRNEPSLVIDTTLSTPVTLRERGSVGNEASVKVQAPTTLTSKSETETKGLAGRLMLKYWNEIGQNGLVVGLDGDLGMGKTIFAKGVAEFLQIKEKVVSPTYSYIEEYDFTRHQTTGKFYHLDMWKVENQDHFERLEVDKLFGPKTIVVIEWFAQVEKYIQKDLQNKKLIKIVLNQIKNDDKNNRQLTINTSS